jgi:hypothetical protein
MITDVGIDLDGVMYDFAKVFHTYAQDRMNKTLSTPTKWDFYKEWGMSDTQFEVFLEDAVASLRIFDFDNPMPYTYEGWDLLKSSGIKIHVLTHRNPTAYEQTSRWLYRHRFVPDSLHFGTNKAILKQLAKDEAAAIDDYPPYYDQYTNAGILSFLRTQPWNEERLARRVDNLLDFAKAINVINDSREFLTIKNTKSPQKPIEYMKITNLSNSSQLSDTRPMYPHTNDRTILKYTQRNISGK